MSQRGGPVVDRRITEELAAYVANFPRERMPEEAIEAARRFALDFAGVALRGSLEPSSRVAADAVRNLAPVGTQGSTMIGYRDRTLAQYAALLNGISLHGLELDDTHPEGGIHVGGAVFAAAFAIAEQVSAGGAEVLAAAVVGYDVSTRLAMALPLLEHGSHGFHSTGTCGVFGAAAVAARLYGLNADQTANALGIAGSQSAGSLEYRTEGAWTKRFHPGWAGHSGIVAATLARSGFTGPHRIVEGRAGFLRSYSDNPRPEIVLDRLGEQFQILRTAIKPHSACRHSQAAIDAMLTLVVEHDVQPSQIERVRVGIFRAAFPSVAEPIERKRRPQTVIDAQFNIFFAAAAAALWRRITVDDYGLECLASPELLDLMDRVECVADPELDSLFPKVWPAKVEIVLKDGRLLQARVDHPRGDPENPLSWNELKDKFDALAAPLLDADRRTEVVAAAEAFERRPASDFIRLLAAG